MHGAHPVGDWGWSSRWLWKITPKLPLCLQPFQQSTGSAILLYEVGTVQPALDAKAKRIAPLALLGRVETKQHARG